MTSPTIKISDDGQRLIVNGALSFANVALLRAQGDELIVHLQKTIIVDFKEVTQCDSSALTLLTAWTRMAKQSNKQIQFLNLPTQLLDLAKLSDLDKILALS